MTLLIIYLLLALLVSCLCSIAEAVLLSVRPSYVRAMQAKKHRSAPSLRKLTSNLDRPLAAILTANTISHTVGAAGVGAQAAVVFGNQYLGIVSGLLTFLILVFSEIIPKTLGATYWQELAPLFAFLINGLTRLLHPFVWMSEKLTRMISSRKGRGATYSRAEMKAMAEIGGQEGVLDQRESQIVANLLRLKKIPVREIMTPRPVVFSVPADLAVSKFFSRHASTSFSRIPLFESNQDNISGYVLRNDLLKAQAEDQFETKLSDFRRDFLVVPDSQNAAQAFDRLMHEKSHIALVTDEYGTMQGLVTLEDVIETLIGLEIVDELDSDEDMQQLALKHWRRRMQRLGLDPDSMNPEENS